MIKGIRAVMIVEVAGRPPEHLKEALKNHVSLLKGLKGVEVFSDTYSEPKKIENSHDMFSCFAEVEFEVETFLKLTDIVFDFMPASIEIIYPSRIEFNMSDATSFLNTLAGRLHRYDEFTGVAQMQARELAMKLEELQKKGLIKRELPVTTNIGACEEKETKKKVKKK